MALLHTAGVALMAALLGALLGPQAAAQSLVADHGDAIYSGLVLSMVNSARPAGFAIGPPFDGLGWAGIAFPSGSSAVGIHVLELLVDLALVFATALLLGICRARPRRRLLRRLSSKTTLLAASLAFAFAVGAQLRLSWSGGSGGELALSMVATKILGIDGAVFAGMQREGWLLSLLVNLILVAVSAGVGFGLSWLAVRLAARRRKPRWRVRAWLTGSPRRLPLLAGLAGLSLLVAPMQNRVVFQAAPGAQPMLAAELAELPAVVDEAPVPVIEAQPAPTLAPPVDPNAPSVVKIEDHGYGYEYVVNGQVSFVRGIGYNAQTRGLSLERRAERYDRDFGEIAAMGANTITGWDQSQFDETLLASAADHGLGVILPFDLQPNWAYEDPRVRQQLLDSITTWVQRFRDSPGLRMWGLGNEVIHGMVKTAPRRVPAFAEFLIQAADTVHALDPDHPVIYREAEDVFLPPIEAALRGGQPRPWFVYGMNFFTGRLAQSLTTGQAARLRQPLLVSEFGPVGLRPADRPAGYQRLWAILVSHRAAVLGGCAYVWTTAGPEPLDRGFGLTDEGGKPVDGALAGLTAAFTAERQSETPT